MTITINYVNLVPCHKHVFILLVFQSLLGDNFIRAKGDTLTMANAQVFTWEAAEKGIDVHLQVREY